MKTLHKFSLSLLSVSLLISTSVFADYSTDSSTNGSAMTNDSTMSSDSSMPMTDKAKSQLYSTGQQQTPTPEEDKIITSSIKDLLKKSKTLAHEKIDVTTNQGVVTLSGLVSSDSQASSAVELAQSIIGVSDVNASKLEVKGSQQPLEDTLITAKAKGLLIREKLFGTKDTGALKISVETKNGVIYLTGHIDNPAQVQNAINVLQKIKGVSKVVYNVKKVTPVN